MKQLSVVDDAHRINQITGRPMAECERQAIQIAECVREMSKRIVEFYYMKKDGTKRQAFGTLQPEVIVPLISKAPEKEPNPDLVTYYDTEAQGFRSFKKVNFVEYVKAS